MLDRKYCQRERAYSRVCLLDMPGSAMGKYERVQRRCRRKSHQSHYDAIEEGRSYKRMYTNSAQNRNERKIEREPPEWAKTWANKRKRAIGYEESVHSILKRREKRRSDKNGPKNSCNEGMTEVVLPQCDDFITAPNIQRIESAEIPDTTTVPTQNVGRNKRS